MYQKILHVLEVGTKYGKETHEKENRRRTHPPRPRAAARPSGSPAATTPVPRVIASPFAEDREGEARRKDFEESGEEKVFLFV
jgi:hypothetical protein